MKKRISFTASGQRADIGAMTIYRILPNRYASAVGPFVFLDHIAPAVHTPKADLKKAGTGAHPHRGIATLSYILNGEDEHFDSMGNYAKVSSGGIQWMKAGNGIIHDENLTPDPKNNDWLTHAFQFWINLPSKIKAEKPAYLAIQADKVPQKKLPDEGGWIKVIVGEYEELSSSIPNYTGQFLYHIHLEPEKDFSITIADKIEVAALLPAKPIIINDARVDPGEFVAFDKNAGTIALKNDLQQSADIILFGGASYLEPIVAEGPFVMNSCQEIVEAYKDFYAGKYGKINY